MKKIIILISLILISSFIINAAVNVNGVDINKEDIRFCQLVAKGRLFSKKITIIVDYGQKTKLLSKEQRIIVKDGKAVKFHSVIAALNFMDKNGWEHVDSYALGSENVLHYLFKKKDK